MEETLFLSESEKDALAEFGNIAMGSAATTVSKLVNKKVSITTPTVWISRVQDVQKKYPNPCVIVSVEYTSGMKGRNLLIIKESDARIIADLMMGGGTSDPDARLTEIQLSAVSECMNQMMGSSATSLSQLMGVSIVISPPNLRYVDLGEGHSRLNEFIEEEEVVAVAFRMEIEGIMESELVQVIPLKFARQVAERLLVSVAAMGSPAEAGNKSSEVPIKEEQPKAHPGEGVAPPSAQGGAVGYGADGEKGDRKEILRMAMLKNLPIRVSVLLGKARMPLGEILQLAPGSVIELDRLEDEPVDIVANDRVIARGEVVLVDDQFGVRILEIIGPEEREETFHKGR